MNNETTNSETVVGSIEVKVEVTAQDIGYILSAAFEGGINYWCREIDIKEDVEGARYRSEVVAMGGSVMLVAGGETEGDFEPKELNLQNFLDGLQKYAYIRPEILEDIAGIDALEADCVVQLAVFGEIIYG